MPNILDELNEKQREAAAYMDGPLLILAGAGSGKTRTLTYRVANLVVNHGVATDRIMLTTFTNKAAAEMQERLQKIAGIRLSFAGTFHSLSARILRRYGSEIGLDPNYSIYDSADQLALIKVCLKDLDYDQNELNPKSVQFSIDSAKNELIDAKQFYDNCRGEFQKKTAKVYIKYEQKLRQASAVDFSDLLFRMVILLKTSDSVREQLMQQFEHVLIDEYQDTNKAQYVLSKVLSAKHRNLCVVGDASQAIYSFRGADYRNLQLLKQDYPDLKTVRLERNYRSSQNILDAAYGVIRNNKSHPILDLWTESSAGEQIVIKEEDNERDEVDYVIRMIRDLQKQGSKLNSMAILYRTNAQSRVIEELMIRRGIPYLLVGGVKFYDRKEVKDVLSYLRLAYNPLDEISRNRVIKLGKRRFAKFEQWLHSNSDNDTEPLKILEDILTVTDYLSRFDKKKEEDASRIENVQELHSVAGSFRTMSDFLENVALVEQDTKSKSTLTTKSGQLIEESDAVILMTLHASKGLEFENVFLLGLEESLFPHSRALFSRDEMEEERRLCYVGITRAKQRLHLSYTKQRMYFGKMNRNMPSRFIDEIPKEITDRKSGSRIKPSEALSDEALDAFLAGDIDIEALLGD